MTRIKDMYVTELTTRNLFEEAKMIQRYKIVLINDDGEKIIIETPKKYITKFAVGEDVDFIIKQPQTKIHY